MIRNFGEQTEEEIDLEYLKHNPTIEYVLWVDWVETVCGWRKIALPSPKEWEELRQNFRHNTAPVDSVNELEAMRKLSI